jgi:hypothetical protein
MTSVFYHARRQVAVMTTLTLLSLLPAGAQQQSPVRKADEDVKDPRLRQAQGLKPTRNLLFNGWGVTPAGQHVTISDLPLKMVVSPDKKMLLAASAGVQRPRFEPARYCIAASNAVPAAAKNLERPGLQPGWRGASLYRAGTLARSTCSDTPRAKSRPRAREAVAQRGHGIPGGNGRASRDRQGVCLQ